MADIVTNTLQIGNDNLILRDADAQEKISDLKEDLSENVGDLKSALTTKAEQDGAYPDITAGQMLSKNEETDSVPYNFRAVGHEATLEYTDAIVGGTIVNNQFCNDPTFTDESKWYPSSTMTVTISNNVAECIASAVNATLTNNGIGSAGTLNAHVVGVLCDLKADEAYNVNIAFGDNYFFTDLQDKAINTSWTTYGMLAKHAEVKMESVYAGIRDSHNSDWKKIYVKNYRVFDLTQMFGTTIADYIYTLETATSGAGVSWLRKHFPKLFTYQEYNAGEIVSVQGLSQHVTTGFNQWNEEWEVGDWYLGNKVDGSNNTIRCKNPIKVLPNTTYFYLSPYPTNIMEFLGYDKQYLSRRQVSMNSAFTIPADAFYVVFSVDIWYGTTYNHDICINLSDPTKNGTYEPYQKRTYPLDSDLTLLGILKFDNNNQLYADGDRYLPDGTVQRRYGVVDLGTLNWVYGSDYNAFHSDAFYSAKFTGKLICAKYLTAEHQDYPTTTWGDNKIGIGNSQALPFIYITDSAYTDAAAFKTAMSGVMLVYELATPTTEEADPYTTPQIVDPDGTEEYVSTSIVPVGHESRYPDDLRAKLDGLPWNLSMIAPIENGDKTSQAYAVGKYFLHNNNFCKAKTAIASGATLTLNTNYEVTTVADEIYSALH